MARRRRKRLRRSGLDRLLRRPWAPALAAGLVLLVLIMGATGLAVSCSWLIGRSKVAHAAAFATEPDIRVRIRKGPGTMKIEARGPLAVAPDGGDARTLMGPLTVGCGLGGISAADSAGGHIDGGAGVDVRISADAGGGGLRVDGIDYPGMLILHSRSEDSPEAFDAIAVMGVEDYLPGVVAHEMLARWPKGAYQVQAVSARTYALHDRDRSRKAGKIFDIESTTFDQMYGGISTNPAIVDAVASTRGMVVTWQGGLLRAYYSSTCGGRPGSAAGVWPTGAGFEFNLAAPLQAEHRDCFCQSSTSYTWEVVRSADDVRKRLRAWGRYSGYSVKGAGKVRSFEVTEANTNQRPMKYRLTDERGQEYRVTAEELRVALNWPAPGLAAVTRAGRINSSDFEAEVGAEQVRFRGRGLGHGVGMCQWCAKGMAERGQDWREMIAQFYPGADVEQIY